ncbi:MAG: ZIP family metal transporter [Candidatus Cloacimonetes bacterium]|nr:ZIP family metal transporter [Candidatus Cloacimonadota bacterium]MCF7813428.1 ZIP family metal transporter [Candidatus Cloacimonadota bacterium]MCF7867721.1 ZIP family metal transporter [Candidatus Cloacimonadota bacterium]MCF7883193.1 ZIP family metal transporter [Candidatus Cloacimonadota bacterium]
MEVFWLKSASFFLIFITGLTGGFFAHWLSKRSNSKIIFSLGNAFAGGVFLGAGLIHMLPDAQSGFAAISSNSDYPWFAVICIAGFLTIFFLERVLLHHSHDSVPETDNIAVNNNPSRILYPYVLMFILSIHSIIAGIALGIEEKAIQAIVILLAVLAHKGTAAFALGVSMLRNNTDKKKYRSMITFFSFMTPLGIMLGYLFSVLLSGSSEQIFEAIFDALAAGTFIYVAVMDILDEEFTIREKLITKFSFVLVGLAIMAVVAIWT